MVYAARAMWDAAARASASSGPRARVGASTGAGAGSGTAVGAGAGAAMRKPRNLTREEYESLKYDIIRRRTRNGPLMAAALFSCASATYAFTIYRIKATHPGDLEGMEPLPPSDQALMQEVADVKARFEDAAPRS
mmetsp:Transcript_809/g.2202  ORF Transcript_809/g.2202 Transcript_809/m.2202 type:complete len:135 (-) Transcript_809:925-1329(-)